MPSQRLKGFKVFKRLEGLKGFKGFKGLEGLEGFKRLRAGKRQTWTPIRSHRCVALGGLQEWPEEAIDVWPRGGGWLQDEACQVSV